MKKTIKGILIDLIVACAAGFTVYADTGLINTSVAIGMVFLWLGAISRLLHGVSDLLSTLIEHLGILNGDITATNQSSPPDEPGKPL